MCIIEQSCSTLPGVIRCFKWRLDMKWNINSQPASEKITYPCLMRGESGEFYLFSGPQKAVKLTGPDAGGYCDSWPMKNFTVFDGSITLSND